MTPHKIRVKVLVVPIEPALVGKKSMAIPFAPEQIIQVHWLEESCHITYWEPVT